MKQTAFETAFNQLNSAQKKAVSTIDGPVLALAGPGTGKTQVLTLRIGEILKKTDMNPYNILCLTFTDAAASEMRERLTKLIGTAAYDVTITTFHGFANSIIQDFSYKFGSIFDEGEVSFKDLTHLDDLERLKIISDLLTQRTWKTIKPFKQPLKYLSVVAGALGDIKRERIDPTKLITYCRQQMESLKQENKKKDITTLNKLERTIELAQLFALYQQTLTKKDFYFLRYIQANL